MASFLIGADPRRIIIPGKVRPQIAIHSLRDASGLVVAEIEKKFYLCRLETSNLFFPNGSAAMQLHSVKEVFYELTFKGDPVLNTYGETTLGSGDKAKIAETINRAIEKSQKRHPILNSVQDFLHLPRQPEPYIISGQVIPAQEPTIEVVLGKLSETSGFYSGQITINGKNCKNYRVELSLLPHEPVIGEIPTVTIHRVVKIHFFTSLSDPGQFNSAQTLANSIFVSHEKYEEAHPLQLELPLHEPKRD